jgi:NADH dehydrogenase [ubiquinone] 1 alpha subcomplex assembly factor 2
MSKPTTSLIKRLQLTYKVSRFPWKKHALIGYDLDGNEYWDCPNPLGMSKLTVSI